MSRLVDVPAVVVDMTEKAGGNNTATLEAEDLDHWVTRNGQLPAGCVVCRTFHVRSVEQFM